MIKTVKMFKMIKIIKMVKIIKKIKVTDGTQRDDIFGKFTDKARNSPCVAIT